MPANKYALIRYRVIDEALTNRYRKYPTLEDLREACEDAIYGSQDEHISISTIEKDLRAMRNDTVLGYEAPIKFHRYEKGYYYTDESYSIKKVPLGEEDLEALRFAAQTLYQFKDIPVFQAFEQTLSKLKEHVSLSDHEFDTGYLDHMLFEESDMGRGDRFLPELLKSIRERHRVAVTYAFFDKSKPVKTYTLEPYLLKQHRLRWYLIARDVAADRVKTFGLERVQEVSAIEERYLAPDFDAKDFFKDFYGISHINGKVEQVRLLVDRPQSQFLLSMPMHASMQLVGEEQGRDILEMCLVVNQDLSNELMSWMPHVEVMSPSHLRESIKERCEGAFKKNISAP